jgi:IS605 OrfB family transposase
MSLYSSIALSDKTSVPLSSHVALDASLVVVSSKPAACGVVTYKTKLPAEYTARLDELEIKSKLVVARMLLNRKETSSKFYKEVTCVIAKSLSAKYQRNAKCVAVRRICLPICGDKGKQVKLADGGLRVPALFKKAVIACQFPLPVSGFVRCVELFQRSGDWFMAYSYNTACAAPIVPQGVIGVDRNSVGNIATIVAPQANQVRFIGFNADRWKSNFRSRKAKVMSQGRKRLASRLRRKQSCRTKLENHRAAKTIVAFAKYHRSAIALEDLHLTKGAKRYADTRQWAHAQLEQFIRYKAALSGVPIIMVSPSFTSQDCSRCGSRNKPNGKTYSCSKCGSKTDRDANASRNIAQRGWESICRNGSGLNVPLSSLIGEALSGKGEALHV